MSSFMPLCMQIGLGIRMITLLQQTTLFFSKTILFLGTPRTKNLSPILPQNLNIEKLPTPLWLESSLLELHISIPSPIMYCEHVSTTYPCVNPLFHSKLKHAGVDFRFVQDCVAAGTCQCLNQATLMFSSTIFRRKIGVRQQPPILRGIMEHRYYMYSLACLLYRVIIFVYIYIPLAQLYVCLGLMYLFVCNNSLS